MIVASGGDGRDIGYLARFIVLSHSNSRSPGDIWPKRSNTWLSYWISVFLHITGASRNVNLVSYEKLCSEGAGVIAEHLGLDRSVEDGVSGMQRAPPGCGAKTAGL